MPSPESVIAVPSAGSIILVRHGQPQEVIPKSFLGHSDPVLNALGTSQAQRAAAEYRRLAVCAERLPAPSCLWSSDLRRAAQTAEPIAREFAIPVQLSADLREINFGDWDGRSFVEVDEAEDGAASGWFRDPMNTYPSNGEHLDQVYTRVARFASSILPI